MFYGGGHVPIRFDHVETKYQYRWPDGSVENYEAVFYDVSFGDRRHRVIIGFTNREAFGRERRRVVIFVDGWPEVEFAGADDYDLTGRLVAMIRRPDGAFMHISSVSSEYAALPVVEHSSCIDRSYGGRDGTAALVVTSDDHKTMIKHALIQSKWRRARRT
jgi:hypothetical protein